MDVADIAKLFEHMWWADELTLASLAGPVGPDAELYAHVVATELVWLDRIQGAPQSVAVWPAPGVEECRRLQAESRRRYADYLRSLTDGALARTVAYTNSAGKRFETPVVDILVHVALHGAYHRGQIARAVRGAGGTPEPTDYVAFVRGAPAATREDAERARGDRP